MLACQADLVRRRVDAGDLEAGILQGSGEATETARDVEDRGARLELQQVHQGGGVTGRGLEGPLGLPGADVRLVEERPPPLGPRHSRLPVPRTCSRTCSCTREDEDATRWP